MRNRGVCSVALLQPLLALFIIETLLFFLSRLGLPDPTTALVSEGMSAEQRTVVREQLGLDQPLYPQYLIYLQNILTGDFGTSSCYRALVADIIRDRLANRKVLTLLAIFIAHGIGVPSAMRCCQSSPNLPSPSVWPLARKLLSRWSFLGPVSVARSSMRCAHRTSRWRRPAS